MGKKHRERRKQIKKELRAVPKGWRENEFGELKRKVSKAEARERYLKAWDLRMKAEMEIIEAAARKVLEEIHAVEDARVFGDISLALEALAAP